MCSLFEPRGTTPDSRVVIGYHGNVTFFFVYSENALDRRNVNLVVDILHIFACFCTVYNIIIIIYYYLCSD